MNITLNDVVYATSKKLDVFTQLHLARKLGPSIPIVEDTISKQSKDRPIFSIIMFSKLDDQDVDYIIKKCLGAVSRQQPTGFTPIQTPQGVMMFDDISLDTLLQLTLMVIEENLGSFFTTSLTSLEQ
jgi:hypothetical protein